MIQHGLKTGLFFLIGCLAASLTTVCAAADVESKLVDMPPEPARIWPSEPPSGCPFPASEALAKICFTGRHVGYANADTWFPSWAADNKMYSPWTDGGVNGTGAMSIGEKATTGNATITGDDPFALTISNPHAFAGNPAPYRGRYPAGSLMHDGIWYYGTYALGPHELVPRPDGVQYNWPWLGPLVGFRWSTDFGTTWHETPHTPDKSLFGESALHGEPVKIGAAHFVDFGKEMEHSPDGKAYLVSHGASNAKDRRYGYNSWITGDEIYLIRVTPSLENMNDASKYEFFAGNDEAGKPVWSHDFSKLKPIAAWQDNMGCVTMTYDAPLKKYLMCVTDGINTVTYFNTYVLESDNITGPWKLVTYMKHFGEEAYFVNVPSKFISADGHSLWLCYSANFASPDYGGAHLKSNPAGGGYGMCLQECKLLSPKDPMPQAGVLENEDNLARKAKVVASSVYEGYSEKGAVDGSVELGEWASKGESNTATLRLTWDQEQTTDRVWLFDRPNNQDQVKAGLLVFSDGTTVKTGELPDDAKQGLEVKFPAKHIKWLEFRVTETKPGTPNVGLSEIAVFRSKT